MSGKLEAMKPQRKIEMFSGSYFAACTLGGIIGTSFEQTFVDSRNDWM
jgi:solute carrier family 25 phosphate transporter 3